MSSSADLALLARQLGLASVGAAGATGELLGSEGGTLTSPDVSVDACADEEVDVGVLLVDVGAGADVCGGFVGKDKSKFCCVALGEGRSGCGVLTHQKKAPLKARHAYIRCPPARGSKADTAFLTPSLDTGPLPDVFKSKLLQEQPVAMWSIYFATVQDTTNELSEENQVELLDRGSRQVLFSATPAKSTVGRPFRSGNEDDDGSDVESDTKWPPLGAPIPEGSPTSLDDKVVVGSQIRAITQVLDQVRIRLPKAEGAICRLGDDTAKALDGVDSKLTGLYGWTGEPDKEVVKIAPSPQLWGCMGSVLSTLQGQEKQITELREHLAKTNAALSDAQKRLATQQSAVSRANAAKEASEGLKSFVARLYQDFEELKMASGNGGLTPTAACDIADLKARLDDVEIRAQSELPMESVVRELTERLETLEVDSSGFKLSLGGEVVKVNDQPFHSATELEDWLVDKVASEGVIDVWFDVVSMLETLQDVSRGTNEQMDSQSRAKKGGHDSLLAGRVVNSFATTIPEVFTKTNGDPFSKIGSFKEWNGRDGRTGLVPRVKKLIDIWKPQQLARIKTRLTGKPEAALLARELLNKAINFWTDLATWVDEFYARLTSREGSLPTGGSVAERKLVEESIKDAREEAWKLIVKILDDMFQELAQRRAQGQTAQDGVHKREQSACVLYATLCAHKFMDELLLKNFERHPCMTPTFNAFLFLERASHSDLKRVEARLEGVEKQTQGLQGKLDNGAKAKK